MSISRIAHRKAIMSNDQNCQVAGSSPAKRTKSPSEEAGTWFNSEAARAAKEVVCRRANGQDQRNPLARYGQPMKSDESGRRKRRQRRAWTG
jgi:hypothetical protein